MKALEQIAEYLKDQMLLSPEQIQGLEKMDILRDPFWKEWNIHWINRRQKHERLGFPKPELKEVSRKGDHKEYDHKPVGLGLPKHKENQY